MPTQAVPTRSQVHTHTFPNGMTLLAQPMPAVNSAAFSFLLPGGAAADPVGAGGAAGVLAEWVVRGAGNRDSRQLSDHLDGLGLQRGQGAGRETTSFDGVLLGPQLAPALEAYADILLRPRLDENEFEQTRELALQEIEAMEDQPASKWNRELWRRWWPFPYSRPSEGTREELEALTPAAVADEFRSAFRPAGTILAVAGDIEWASLRDTVGRLFGSWSGAPRALPSGEDTRKRVSQLIEPIEQTHVGLAAASIPAGHPNRYDLNIVVGVLSGGMGARLFTEVREKRGLCYSVSASIHGLKGHGVVVAYANPEPPKAQETIEVLLAELRKLNRDGITADELARAKTGVKSRLVMAGESTRARAGIIAGDWFHLGRVRPVEEVRAGIDAVTVDTVAGFLRNHPFKNFTAVTLGPKPIEMPPLD